MLDKMLIDRSSDFNYLIQIVKSIPTKYDHDIIIN